MEIENKWKYIVYLTTNLNNNKIYIGVHKTDPNKFDGYIGCGVYINQPSSYQYPKTAFQNAVKKYGPKSFVRETIRIFDNEDDAYLLEEELVDENFLARPDVYNLTLGGRNTFTSPIKVQVFQYTLQGEYIASFDSIKDAAASINKDHSAVCHAVHDKIIAAGYLWSTDKVDKLDISLYNLGINQRRKVYVYKYSGEYFTEYESLTECNRQLKISTSLSNYLKLGLNYKKEYYFCYVKAESFDKARNIYIKNRPIYQFDSNGEFVRKFDHQYEAEEIYRNSNINLSIKTKTLDANNYYWGIEDVKKYNCPNTSNYNSKRQVGKYDLDNNLVCIYESATMAANENGTSVWKVLNGSNKTHKNHIYKYLS